MSSATERFLRYVSFDTQSDDESQSCPSTEKQKLLGERCLTRIGVGDDGEGAPTLDFFCECH